MRILIFTEPVLLYKNKSLPQGTTELSNAVNQLISKLDSIVKSQGHIPFGLNEFLMVTDRSISTSYKFWNMSVNELDILLTKRVDSYKSSKNRGILLTFVSFLLFAGVVFHIFRSLSETLKQQLFLISKSSRGVDQGSRNVSTESVSLSEATTEQAGAIAETSSSMEEMSSMLNQTATNSAKTLQDAEEGQKETEKGKQVIANMMAAMDEIHSSNNRLEALVKLIQEIDNKTRVINNIVFETRLLSFNASIEAARAGVHGKGFRDGWTRSWKLASMSGKAAEDIRNLLDSGIQK